MSKEYIEVINAHEHNLKNISLKIPREEFVVITGLSGSGKSSLAFDTLFAEGQRRYVESLSSYARQFLGRIKKPAVERINGLPPAVAVEQKTSSANSRSTVGTATEIYDYLRILYARIGKTYSPVSGKPVKRHTIDDVVKFIEKQPKGAKIYILAPLNMQSRSIAGHLDFLQRQGFLRVEIKINNENQTWKIIDLQENTEIHDKIEQLCLVVDRLKASTDSDTLTRIADSTETAFFEGGGICKIKVETDDEIIIEEFSNSFEADGITFREPDLNMFNFNNPIGACEVCNGYGSTIDIDEDLVVPNKQLSIFEDAVACWRGEKLQYYKNLLIRKADALNFNIHKPYYKLSKRELKILWEGTADTVGIYEFFDLLKREQHKIQNRILLARFRGKTICRACNGSRLKKDASYVKIGGKAITDLVNIQLNELLEFFNNLKLNKDDAKIAERPLIEIRNRLEYLCDVGLEYLTLNRPSATLSGGEAQRINLATMIGSNLTGALYVLDEPTIGLHPRDTRRLVKILKKLQTLGNTVLVVEHERQVIENADFIIDLGPLAGSKGGEVVFTGTYKKISDSNTLTAQYISGKKEIPVPKTRRKSSKYKGFIELIGVRQNNLKNLNVKFPLGLMVAVTGVSGSGKSSLVKDVLYPALLRKLNVYTHSPGRFDEIKGDIDKIHSVEFVDQNPIGRSSRSNPATYIKAFDDIRQLFSIQKLAKINGFTPGYFSFNTDGGRCDVCKGDGYIKIEMQFMADVTIVCEACKGKRFKDEVLEVTFKDKNIYDILEMTVDDAIDFFSSQKGLTKQEQTLVNSIVKKLSVLSKVGLGYVKTGQGTSTLSGGETQRLKLASFIIDNNPDKHTVFIFDEPTTGLHFDDINKLLTAFNELVNKGHTVIFIEHNLDMIKVADWVIDLGPEGGNKGGEIIFEGTPEDLINCKRSHTAKFLKEEL